MALPRYIPNVPQPIPAPPTGPIDFFNYEVEDWLSITTSTPWCTYFYNKPSHHLATYIFTDPRDTRYLAQFSFPDNWRFIPGWHRHFTRAMEECFTSEKIPHHLHFPPLRPTAPHPPLLDPGDTQQDETLPRS